MLDKNQIGQNPRRNRRTSTPAIEPAVVATPPAPARSPWAFGSADDYDATGILAGVDLSASLYWWMPDLYTSPMAPPGEPQGETQPGIAAAAELHASTGTAAEPGERGSRSGQAARRPGSRSPAAA